ncbi:hypothetical protein D187_003652 [Cystobacter fuscus DSM 2262]|uniref:Uncharacterized protein n=1 Tax=Cystobacter fuscus (strain ATCC 25194 / DSM 2262 / NBRC 100088 / M29) TaxID=1242864 RepID=S9P9I1_CYSF2|nr:hypothetical protein D187_003652 [Cystobacter fuscus DSM 2262]
MILDLPEELSGAQVHQRLLLDDAAALHEEPSRAASPARR